MRAKCQIFPQEVNQRGPEPQPKQPCYWAMPLKLCIMGNWPRSLLVVAFGISKSEFTWEGGKRYPIDACFSACLLSFLFTSLFLSSLLFFFQFSLFFLPSFLPFPIYGYCSYLYRVNLMKFLYFTPKALSTVSSLRWTPIQSCPTTH